METTTSSRAVGATVETQAVVMVPKPKRSIQLDLLRGVAILLVLGNHSVTLVTPEKAGRFRPVSEFFERFGWTGVDLFFVLSGFLIGGLLFNEIKKYGALDVRRFIVRRGLKIWPSYYIFLGWLLVQSLRAHHSLHDAIQPLIPNLLHIQNYVYMNQEFTWSLALEEHFYLCLPFVLWMLIRKREQSRLDLFPKVFAAIAVTCLALRCIAIRQYPLHPGTDALRWAWKVFTPTHLRMDSLLFGVLLAYLTHFRPSKLQLFSGSSKARWTLLATGLALISPMLLFSRQDPTLSVLMNTLGLTLLYLGYGCILIACVHSATPQGAPTRGFRNIVVKAVAGIGFYSYPIYLWHINQGRDRALSLLYHGKFEHMSESTRWLVVVGLYMVFAIVFGIVFSMILEKPTLALRDRMFPDRARV